MNNANDVQDQQSQPEVLSAQESGEWDPTMDDVTAPYPPGPEEILRHPETSTRASAAPPPDVDVNLKVPFIHQLWDTPDNFNGHWACTPTSSAMVLAFYGLLPPDPITIHTPEVHQNNYGRYIAEQFTLHGKTFDARSETDGGRAQGLYGSIVANVPNLGWVGVWEYLGKGVKPVMDALLPAAGKVAKFGGTSLNEIRQTLDTGNPVIVAGVIFTYRHVLVVRGYYCDPTGACHLIVNDPYGFKTQGRKILNGGNVVYEPSEIDGRWAVHFRDA